MSLSGVIPNAVSGFINFWIPGPWEFVFVKHREDQGGQSESLSVHIQGNVCTLLVLHTTLKKFKQEELRWVFNGDEDNVNIQNSGALGTWGWNKGLGVMSIYLRDIFVGFWFGSVHSYIFRSDKNIKIPAHPRLSLTYIGIQKV